MNTTDIFFSSAMLLLVAIEFTADQQQWNYHNAKHEYQKTAKVPHDYYQEDLDLGFNTSGLWSVSR
jgi:steroid 5-alpha reductase family enzyme